MFQFSILSDDNIVLKDWLGVDTNEKHLVRVRRRSFLGFDITKTAGNPPGVSFKILASVTTNCPNNH